MSVINTNMAGIIATNAITRNDRAQETAMERLSTGKRINSAGDDAAGLAISERMRAEVSGLKMSVRNSNDAISMLETAEGASSEIVLMFQRMRELAVQASSDTYSATDRDALDLEFGQLMAEVERTANNTTWNTMTILNGGNPGVADVTTKAVTTMTATIQVGKATGETMTLTLKSWNPRGNIDVVHQNYRRAFDGLAANGYVAGAGASNNWTEAVGGTVAQQSSTAYGSAVLWTGGDDGQLNGANAAGPPRVMNDERDDAHLNHTRISIAGDGAQSVTNAQFAITQLDVAINAASAERAMYGAYISRLEHAGDNLTNVARNQEQSRSRIADADYAVETSELSRTSIIAQASTAMLAQANQSKQIVLALLE